jgi:hypothetical protein
MRLVAPARPLYELSHRAGREAGGGAAAAVRALLDMHATLGEIHRAGLVVGDLNDLNVLVGPGGGEAHWIDVDSWSLGPWPCLSFTDRFWDPRLAAGSAPDRASDWYAYAVMLLQSLLFVGPWGGVHPQVPAAARAPRRLSVLAPGVRWPKPAAPREALPDELLHQLQRVFAEDLRAPLPRALLDALEFRRCPSCGLEHARRGCPVCAPGRAAARAPAVIVRGRVTARRVAPPPPTPGVAVREHGGRLWRGDEPLGEVLAGRTRFWHGDAWGMGAYHAGELRMAFVFETARRALRDGLAVPLLGGEVFAAGCVFAGDRAWFHQAARRRGATVRACTLLRRDGTVVATTEGAEPWLESVAGACGVGDLLFVPTDDGLQRVEVRDGELRATRLFPDTEPFVSAESRLSLDAGGILATNRQEAFLLQMGDPP